MPNYSSSPFINNGLATGGSTTQPVQGLMQKPPMQGPQQYPGPRPDPGYQPIPAAGSPIGIRAASPLGNQTQPSATLPANQIDTNYQLKQGETLPAYTARIAAYNASKGTSSTPNTTGVNVNTQAPPPPTGNSYGGPSQGGLNQDQINAANNAQAGIQGNIVSGTQQQANTAQNNQPQNNAPQGTPQSSQSQQQNNQQFTPNTGLFGQLLAALANRTNQDSPDLIKAKQDFSAFQGDYAKQLGAIQGNPIPLEFQQGREQVLQNQYAAGLPYYQAELGAAVNTQGQQFNALGNAVNAAAPTLGSYGQAQYSPLGGTIGGGTNNGGSLNPLNNVQSIAQQIISGHLSPSQGYAMGGNVPNFQGVLNQELQKQQPGFDAAKAEGSFAGKQQSATTIGTAGATSISDLTQQGSQIQSVFNGAEANFKLLVDTAKQGGVNDTSVPILNTIQQNVSKGLTSNAAVVDFQNTIATVRSQYAQILGGGQSTVDSNQRAAQAIPDNISLGALQSLEQQLHSEATNRIQGINQQIQQLKGNQGTSASGGFQEGQTSKDGSLVYKGGKWAVNK